MLAVSEERARRRAVLRDQLLAAHLVPEPARVAQRAPPERALAPLRRVCALAVAARPRLVLVLIPRPPPPPWVHRLPPATIAALCKLVGAGGGGNDRAWLRGLPRATIATMTELVAGGADDDRVWPWPLADGAGTAARLLRNSPVVERGDELLLHGQRVLRLRRHIHNSPRVHGAVIRVSMERRRRAVDAERLQELVLEGRYAVQDLVERVVGAAQGAFAVAAGGRPVAVERGDVVDVMEGEEHIVIRSSHARTERRSTRRPGREIKPSCCC